MNTTAAASCMAILVSGAAQPILAEKQPALHAHSAEPRLRLDLDRSAYEVGEPIVATARVINDSGRVLSLPTTSEPTLRHAGFSLLVTTRDGRTLQDPRNEYISSMHPHGSWELVQPSGSATRRQLLNYFTPILSPGRYSVKAIWELREREAIGVSLQSNDVAFEVTTTSPAATLDRVSRLVEQLRRGEDTPFVARLLGFTGQPEAIAPLVGLLSSASKHDEVAAAEALRYLDRGMQKDAIVESIRTHPPRDRLVYHFVVVLEATPEEVTSSLLPWLSNMDERVRAAVVRGLNLSNVREPDPSFFAPLVAALHDASPVVRQPAASAVGGYRDAAAFRELTSAVRDPDPGVSQQATIAVGWVAQAAEPGSDLRQEAIVVLRSKVASGGRTGELAARALEKLAE
jgi:hypothetical protein